jgi:DNA-binding transcriptional regulator PaaX
MSLEQFLENDTSLIAAAYELTKWSILKAEIMDYTEKEQKYEEFLQELAVLVEKYKVSDAELFDAQVSLDAESLEDEEMLERADRLMARDANWN